MLGLSFFKSPKHRKFNYIPVYYDEQQEELNERVSEIKRIHGITESNEDQVKASIHRLYKERTISTSYSGGKEKRLYMFKLLLIITVLSYCCYLFLKSNLSGLIFGG